MSARQLTAHHPQPACSMLLPLPLHLLTAAPHHAQERLWRGGLERAVQLRRAHLQRLQRAAAGGGVPQRAEHCVRHDAGEALHQRDGACVRIPPAHAAPAAAAAASAPAPASRQPRCSLRGRGSSESFHRLTPDSLLPACTQPSTYRGAPHSIRLSLSCSRQFPCVLVLSSNMMVPKVRRAPQMPEIDPDPCCEQSLRIPSHSCSSNRHIITRRRWT